MSEEPRFSRIRLMVGDAGLARLRRSFVVVAGLGAVGSYAVEALARAGVGRLRLVDFDEIRPSNVNRQLYALASTLGRPKCEEALRRVLDIQPDCRAEALKLFVDASTVGTVLEGPPDLVIDAIDSLNPKAALLQACAGAGLRVISSMGAALRTDPTLIRVGPLREARNCPLASRVRYVLRRRGVEPAMTCVYSLEPAGPLGRRATSAEEAAKEPGLDRGRKRPAFGSLPTLTGIFGLTAANEALRVLLGDDFPGQPPQQPGVAQ